MSNTHASPMSRRWCDVAVIGGSAAGLAAALMLARSRRSVIVIDAGEPRNAPAAHMHGFLGHEGVAPSELLATARAEVRSYGAEVLDGRVTDVIREDDGRFCVVADENRAISARRVVVATGVVDELPDIDGVADQWGRGVIHCPYCHGYEVRDQRIVVIATSPMSLHQATLFRQLSSDVTVVAHEESTLDAASVDALAVRGVRFIDARSQAVESDPDDVLRAVRLVDGTSLDADSVVVTPRFRVRVEPFASLGLVPVDHPSGLGAVLEADERGATSVPGVYAAGNVVDPSQQVLHAAANGSRVAAMLNLDLAEEDTRTGASPAASSARSEWDARYGGDQIWSGNPNGTLVAEVASLAPGRALDVGCGEGADAVWLAERGWKVTAVDIAQPALDRGAAAALERGVEGIEWLCADLSEARAEQAEYDLVSLQYSALHRDADARAARSLLDAVAPDGTLLVVGHDRDGHTVHGFDPLACLHPDDLAELVAEAGEEWEVVTHERRARPGGHINEHHSDHMHHEDVVLRARRRPALS